MLPFRLVYHEDYDLNLGEHIFPAQKYRMIRDRLLADGFASPEDFVSPDPATDEDMLLVHDAAWVRKLRTGTLSYLEIVKLEIPYSRQMVEGFWLATGGTILAANLALKSGFGFNIGGGFHHGFAAHGEGFCAVNDIAVALRRLQKDGAIKRAMVVDCDVHHGNGTAAIFAADKSVFTLSIHHFENYPNEKPPSTVDVHLPGGVGDEEYLDHLSSELGPALNEFQPGLIVYVAGADPYEQDQLGGLNLTMEGLKLRDRLVMESAQQRGIPVAVVLAGGYAHDNCDTVTIHVNTAAVAKEVYSRRPS